MPVMGFADELRVSDCDRMLEALSLALSGTAGPDRNGCLLPMADDAADVLPCAGLLLLARHPF
jgi:hypothetical protein